MTDTKDIFLGRCKRCKTGRRIHAPVARKVQRYMGYGRNETAYYRTLPNGKQIEGYDYFFVDCDCCSAQGIKRGVHMKKLSGRVSSHECGAHCMSATGNCCECSCGGKNHGGGLPLETAQ